MQYKNRPKELIQWLDRYFEMICDENGIPIVKVHGLGVGSVRLILRYPWYSVDSTTWVRTGRNGKILVPERKMGNWRYDIPPMTVWISEESSAKDKVGRHFDTLPPSRKRIVEEYIQFRGYTPEEARTNYKARDILNIEYFLDLEKNRGLEIYFAQEPNVDLGLSKRHPERFKWMYEHMKTRLYSYYYLKDKPNLLKDLSAKFNQIPEEEADE